jgi:hypothetical protein
MWKHPCQGGRFAYTSKYRRCHYSFTNTHSHITLGNFSSINLVFIFRCSSPTSNPVYVRRVDPSALVFSLSSHRHSYIGLLFSSHSSILNKQGDHVFFFKKKSVQNPAAKLALLQLCCTLLQLCCSAVAALLQRCCSAVATLLQLCCSSVATLLQLCCSSVSALFSSVAALLQLCCSSEQDMPAELPRSVIQ